MSQHPESTAKTTMTVTISSAIGIWVCACSEPVKTIFVALFVTGTAAGAGVAILADSSLQSVAMRRTMMATKLGIVVWVLVNCRVIK